MTIGSLPIKRFAPHLLLILFATAAQAEWIPPENPDPSAILKEAKSDAREKRYEDALAKQVWFYQNALKYNIGMSGVRRSFALKDWQALGKAYPPALDKLKEMRSDGEKAVQAGADVADSFADFAAINRVLGQEKLTTELFIWLDANNSTGAKKAFPFAKRGLVKEHQYELAAKYLEPEIDFANLAEVYHLQIEYAKGQTAREIREGVKEAAETSFSNETATLVALLVKAGRNTEAEDIAARARKEWDSPDFKAQLTKALEGVIPTPRP